MSHFEVGGKIFCDWRLTIDSCEGSRLFETSLLYSSITCAIGFLVLLFCLFFRKFFLKEPWKAFLRGETLFHLVTLLTYATHLAHVISLLLKSPLVVSGVLWSFLEVSKFLTQSTFVTITAQVLPEGLPQSQLKWIPNLDKGTRALSIFCIFASSLHIITLSLAFCFLDSSPSLGRTLEKTGLTITAVNALFLTLGQLTGPCLLKRSIRGYLMEAIEFEQRPFDSTLVILTDRKLGQVIVITFFNNTLIIMNMLLLAYYPNYFSNLSLSEAILIILYPFNFTIALFYSFVCLFFDVKKWIYNQHLRESTRNLAIALPLHWFGKGKEPAEMVVDDLNLMELS